MEQFPLKGLDVIMLDEAGNLDDWFEEFGDSLPEVEISKEDCAYVLYTSGSTGNPKGVMVNHRGLSNYLHHGIETYLTQEINRAIVSSPLSFDATITSLLVPLCGGATVELLCESDELLQQLHDRIFITDKPCLFKLTPAHLQVLAGLSAKDCCSKVAHYIVVGGEQWQGNSLRKWKQELLPAASFVNEYGPTETVVGCSTFEISANDNGQLYQRAAVPIGSAIRNTQLYLLDNDLNGVPEGSVGEIFIGGDGVATGYLNQAELTASAFIENPFSLVNKSRLYRTGDLARYLEGGVLEFIGRIDEQVKVRGYRIELGEIESRLNTEQNVDTSLLVVAQGEADDQQLLAYVKPVNYQQAKEMKLDISLKQGLKNHLPDYMLPVSITLLEDWPLTANGKLDKKQLPQPNQATVRTRQFVAPSTNTQRILTEIWSRLIKLDAQQIDIHTDFFDIGGHSLLAIRLIGEIRSQLDREITIKEIFNSPTIAELSQLIDENFELSQGTKITPVKRDETPLSLSFAQQRLWFIDQMNQGSPEYNMPVVLEIVGAFDHAVASQAINTIISRHESLRTTFGDSAEGGFQQIQSEFEFALNYLDLSNLSVEQQQQEVEKYCLLDRTSAFDLTSDLMLRASYLYLSGEQSEQCGYLLFNMHHIASDGWSMGILIEEFIKLYQSGVSGQPAELAELAIQYADYAHWQRQWLTDEVLDAQTDYWRNQLADIPTVHSLALDYPRPGHKQYAGAVVQSQLTTELSEQLQQVAREHNITPFMLLHGALCLLLSRHTNSQDIVIGTPVANRMQLELEPLIGFFVNTLVLRVNTDESALSDYLQQVKQVNLDAQSNQDISFEQLVEICQLPRSTQHSPLFQIMFSMNTNEVGELQLPGLKISPVASEQAVAKFDLDINAQINEQGINISWTYDKSIFTEQHVSQLNTHLNNLLINIAATPRASLSDLKMLTKSEQRELLANLNQPGVAQTETVLLHQLFEQQVIRTPNEVALVFEQESLTYQALNNKANQLAGYLLAQGVGVESLVGICMERSVEMLVSIFAVLKAGAAYVPMEPDNPPARLSFMLVDTGLTCLLTQQKVASRLSEALSLSANIKMIAVDSESCQQQVVQYSVDNLDANPEQSNHSLAYIIYTSGSTGNPKGVMIEHASAVTSTMARETVYQKIDSYLLLSSFAFDSSVAGIFYTLCCGGKLCLVKQKNLKDIETLSDVIQQHKISHLLTVPSFYKLLSDYQFDAESLRAVTVAGEACDESLVNKHYQHKSLGHARLYNEYGPTEATVWSTVAILKENSPVSIGKPIQGTQLYILDRNGNIQPEGTIGELYIGGSGVARGYWGQPEMTARSFISNPFSGNKTDIIYKTGDLVSYTLSGDLKFIGRVDEQVKVRGYRIETGEIETQLASFDMVDSCVVVVNETGSKENQLVAFVKLVNQCEDFDGQYKARIISQLEQLLPEYMIPSVIINIDLWPLNANGKIDKRALQNLAVTHSTAEFVAAKSPTEISLTEIWGKLLKLTPESISTIANFFEIGGHSLLTVRLASHLKDTFGVELSIADIFDYQTIEKLADFIDTAVISQSASDLADEEVAEEGWL